MEGQITMTPDEASRHLKQNGFNLSAQHIRYGLQQNVYPFGDAVRMKKQTEYSIYKRLLDEWIKLRT
jgi:hypothetical protein